MRRLKSLENLRMLVPTAPKENGAAFFESFLNSAALATAPGPSPLRSNGTVPI
jgi:hypothetical protein